MNLLREGRRIRKRRSVEYADGNSKQKLVEYVDRNPSINFFPHLSVIKWLTYKQIFKVNFQSNKCTVTIMHRFWIKSNSCHGLVFISLIKEF